MKSGVSAFDQCLRTRSQCWRILEERNATAVVLLFIFIILPEIHADTLHLKNGKDIKGLVVENHVDRVILSTEQGEKPILKTRIKDIEYSDPEQNLMQIGKAYEAENKLGEALAYYEKAMEINPKLEEARVAAVGVRNRFWAIATEGPNEEVEKQQAIYDSWKSDRPVHEDLSGKIQKQQEMLNERLGLRLEKKGDWVCVSQAAFKKDAAFVGLKKGDRIVSIDGQSLRYLTTEGVVQKLTQPRFSAFNLEYERDLFVYRKEVPRKDLGFKLKLEYEGLVADKVRPGGVSEAAGLRDLDMLVKVNGQATRYMPLHDVRRLIQEAKKDPVVLTVRRSVSLTRR